MEEKLRLGAPTKPAEKKASRNLNIRLTIAEEEALKRAAEERGITVTALIRDYIARLQKK